MWEILHNNFLVFIHRFASPPKCLSHSFAMTASFTQLAWLSRTHQSQGHGNISNKLMMLCERLKIEREQKITPTIAVPAIARQTIIQAATAAARHPPPQCLLWVSTNPTRRCPPFPRCPRGTCTVDFNSARIGAMLSQDVQTTQRHSM